MPNRNLTAARRNRRDEFYTQLADIERELRHYREHFRDKIVLCNCDDPYESNFFKYFALNFNSLGLRKLICTCYDGSPVLGSELPLFTFDEDGNDKRVAYKVEISEVPDADGDGVVNLTDVRYLMQNDKNVLTILKENGDFRSRECIELLKQSDIVCTNPPFSLFREYIAQLIKFDKKFIVIGHQNAIKYKEIFPLIKSNHIWLGYGFKGSAGHFISPYDDTATAGDHREGMIRVSGVHWFTNIETQKRHDPLILYKKYTPEDNPTYDNYDAIEVGKTSEIPYDSNGLMGVPITFLDKYCPEQFEIVWTTDRGGDGFLDKYKKKHSRFDAPVLNGKGLYTRIFIRKKQ